VKKKQQKLKEKMLGKLSNCLAALGKHSTTNKADGQFRAVCKWLSRFELIGSARLGSMHQSPRLGSAQRAARAGSCRLGSGWLRLVELLQH